MTALYRKYRPQTFREVVGQDLITEPLCNSIMYDCIGHAYLFAGPRGSGKTSIAKIFAKALNCLNPIQGDACNECRNCLQINKGSSMDVIEIDGASNNGVEEVRKIIDQLKFFPATLKNRVYIIDEAQMLSNAAWNALLKTIEDPAPNTIFIFTTTEPHKVLMTVMSRCQRFQFQRLNFEALSKVLTKVISLEKIKITDQAISQIIQLADGSARDALSILDQLNSYERPTIDEQLINQLFGLTSKENRLTLLKFLEKNDLSSLRMQIKHFENSGIDLNVLVQELALMLLDYFAFLQGANDEALTALTIEECQKFRFTNEQLTKWIPMVAETESKIKRYGQPTFYLNLLFHELLLK